MGWPAQSSCGSEKKLKCAVLHTCTYAHTYISCTKKNLHTHTCYSLRQIHIITHSCALVKMFITITHTHTHTLTKAHSHTKYAVTHRRRSDIKTISNLGNIVPLRLTQIYRRDRITKLSLQHK